MNTELIDKIHERAKTCFGVNSLPFDRLFKGNKEEKAYWLAAIRERQDMLAALDIAVLLIQERDDKIAEFENVQQLSGELSMGTGAKRDE